MVMAASSERLFKDYLDSKFPVEEKRTRSANIHREYGERIVRHLQAVPPFRQKEPV